MLMLKNFIALIIASIVFVFGLPYFGKLLNVIVFLHQKISAIVGSVFAAGGAGDDISRILSLLILPLILSFIVYIILWLLHKRNTDAPYAVYAAWVLWIVLAVVSLR